MTRRKRSLILLVFLTLLPTCVFAQGLSSVSTLSDPVAYSEYLRQRRTNEQRVQRLTKQVAKATVTARQGKKIGEAAPRAGFQNQTDYFQNFR